MCDCRVTWRVLDRMQTDSDRDLIGHLLGNRSSSSSRPVLYSTVQYERNLVLKIPGLVPLDTCLATVVSHESLDKGLGRLNSRVTVAKVDHCALVHMVSLEQTGVTPTHFSSPWHVRYAPACCHSLSSCPSAHTVTSTSIGFNSLYFQTFFFSTGNANTG